ncbi:MAG: SMP-30/gluconolactonase/LRE family protein [Gemmataceae bacterium]|nr:SMP-30/gluconolactonase/LRE family protein [Gemmataceae bacterium]
MNRRLSIVACVLLSAFLALGGENPPANKAGRPAADLVPGDAQLTPASIVCFLEGPAVDKDGSVFFSDIAGNRILKRDSKGAISVFRADSGRTNGNTFDAQGRLLSCEGNEQGPGRRRVVRTDLATGQVEVLTDKFEGKRYNSPNDVVADKLGRIWFTDPYYSQDRSSMEMDVEGVYRIDSDGKVTRALSQKEIHRPNGIAVTPDAKTLYVVDSHPKPGGNRKIWSFDIAADGALSKQQLVFDFGTGRGGDGLRLDAKGNLWIAGGISYRRSDGEDTSVPPGVYVVTPSGKLLGRIPIGEDLVTNLAFGGPDKKTLYVTAGKTLYQLPVNVPGHSLYP